MTDTVIQQQIDATQLDIEVMRFEGMPEEVIQEKEKQLAIYNKILTCIQNPVKPLSLREEICKSFGIRTELMFERSRKSEIVNARQVYTYLLMTTDLKNQKVLSIQELKFRTIDPFMNKRDSPSFVGRHIGYDHANIYNCLKTTWNYYQTEKFYKDLIDRLQELLLVGKIEMPNVKIPVS
jgi:hypothetical protein